MITNPAEEERVRDVWRRLAAEWSAGDPAAAAALWAIDCDYKRLDTGDETLRSGRAELERALAEAFTRRRRAGARAMHCGISAVRFLRPDVAVVDGVLQVTFPGSSRIAARQPLAAVMTKQGDAWLIASWRGSTPVQGAGISQVA
jgi:uncharacterized protein (TIGR02246 family)